MANFLTDKLARMGFLHWNPATGKVRTPQGERSLLLGDVNEVTGKVEIIDSATGLPLVTSGGGQKVWRGMGNGMGINLQGWSGGTNVWSRTCRTPHVSNAAFRRCRVVLATAYPTGTPLVDTPFTEDFNFQVGFELDYTHSTTDIPARKLFRFSNSPVAQYFAASPPTNNLIVSDVLDLGREVTAFGLWTTTEAASKSGDNKCPYIRNASNFLQRYIGTVSAAGVSQIAAETAEKATSVTATGAAQNGYSGYYTPAMLLIETADGSVETIIIDGASNSRGTGEGGAGSGDYGDSVGDARSNLGFVARGIDALGWNYVSIATGSDSTKERMTASNWSMRLALAAMANPTKWWNGLGRGDMAGTLTGDYVAGHSVGATYTKPAAVLSSGAWYVLVKAGAGVTTVAPSGTGSAVICGDYVWAYVGPDVAGAGPRGAPVEVARQMKYSEMVRAAVPNIPMTWHVMTTGTTSPSDTTTVPGTEIGLWSTAQGQTVQTNISDTNSRRSLTNALIKADKSLLNFAATVDINDLIEDPATQKWLTNGTPNWLTADGAHYNSYVCSLAAQRITKDSFPV